MTRHHDEETPTSTRRSPANRLGLNYRDLPPHKLDTRIIDVHTHVHDTGSARLFFEAARLYGISKIVSMSPLDEADRLKAAWGDRLEFIAVPRWRELASSTDFQKQWLDDLAAFRERGARRMKFWMAPPMRGEFGLTLKDPFFEPLIARGLELGYEFMVHVGDPSEWFETGGPYADRKRFGTKRDQYPQLHYLAERVAPRTVIAAHMGGYCEEPAFLQELLDRHPNLYLDSSATKWVVRAVARQPEAVRAFLIRNQDRVLFGSDLVVAPKYDFDHYASRYWAHLKMWETAYRGESPIEDPDADDPPRLAGLNLPTTVLRKLYCQNAERLGHGAA
jgi:predicted TIM-barrel fold metal-dependent hydrolase